ncbi:LysR family transcriptional regulator [uncultured Lactobacillus sp.]|uniref:LysR family transcriptional regulator n=1 Tax=uncultured Lactobacillus sp. TaxID=153152 RepID=UPI002631AA6F|nr:LysR family transcriptional regulator [uncultured Lactobacillus sp.]
MEIRVLRYFLAVCESKNISKAANVLHISQPSLSRQLKNLEQELGVVLFKRGPHEITLTEQGYYLRDHAQDIVNMVEKTKLNISQNDVISGELYIGAGESIAMKRIMKVIDSILKDYPDVKVHTFAATAPLIEAKIDNGNLDFGITMGHRKAGNYESLALPEKTSMA